MFIISFIKRNTRLRVERRYPVIRGTMGKVTNTVLVYKNDLSNIGSMVEVKTLLNNRLCIQFRIPIVIGLYLYTIYILYNIDIQTCRLYVSNLSVDCNTIMLCYKQTDWC